MSSMTFGRAQGVAIASLVALSAVAGSGWIVGGAAQAADESPAPAAPAPDGPLAELCPDGLVPMLEFAGPERGDEVGAASARDAVALVATRAVADRATYLPLAHGDNLPVWVIAGEATYIVNPMNEDGWIASPATVADCHAPDELR